jgi:integrase
MPALASGSRDAAGDDHWLLVAARGTPWLDVFAPQLAGDGLRPVRAGWRASHYYLCQRRVFYAALKYAVREALLLTYRGGTYQPSTLWQVLPKARAKAFTPAQAASPLARRPYDFRHAGISWRLNAGITGPQVAEWAGHSVEVLYRIYAHCLEGDDERWLHRMEEALG